MVSKTPAKSAKPAGTASKQASQAMVKALAKQMLASILPSEPPLSNKALADAAQFMLEVATQREAEKSALVMTTVSDEHRFLRLAIVNDDMPFLVDSIAKTITAHGLVIDRLIHPVISVQRDTKGRLKEILPGKGKGSLRESMVYIETERADARQRRALEKDLRTALGDIRAAVSDWPKLQAAMARDAERIADQEAAELLRWFNGGMLTQLGHITRKRDGSNTQALGVCRKSARQVLADASFKRAFEWFEAKEKLGEKRDLLIVKANRLSFVHRHVPLDLFIVPVREKGQITALSIHAGIWTSAAIGTHPANVPILRTMLAQLTDRLGYDPAGHAGKALVHALAVLPHDLLIGFEASDAQRLATCMMSLIDRPRPRLALVAAPLSRHMFAFVWFPRDIMATRVRMDIQRLLTEGEGIELLDWDLAVEGGNLAMLRFVLDIRDARQIPDENELEARLEDMLRGWNEAVERHLAEEEDPGRAAAIAARYAPAFPQAYRSDYGAAEAARDIRRLRALTHEDSAGRGARLYHLEGDPADRLRMKVYQHEGALPLSDAVPALENFGFHVLTEVPTSLERGALGTVHDFTLVLPEGDEAAPLLERADVIEAAIAAVLNNKAENDAFNRLVVGTGLSAAQADWLRAFYRYLRQAGMGFTIYTVVDALRRAPQVTRPLIDLFTAKHDPAFKGDREAAADTANDAIRRGLVKVAAINDDRLLRLYHALIGAILRTNVFAPAAEEALAFKIDSQLVPGLPKPIPWREIFVYSRRVEGIHLRAGPVARGGLRWSDRRDDFRTEILGLMKAQRVKNAVIVPTGAKGGFYPKLLPSPTKDRDGWAAEGQGSYEVFIRTLLSVTDNIEGSKVVHPKDVVIHDGDDPYFVVAADKGTARFSDVANAIAEKADFWLDDAFASGGSHGYDHKAMGITARGAWLSVQRHFLEMGVDVQNDPVRVVGCGDMSGDVFGNGMLLSKAIKLVAAFDHRHIFIDPDPDPAKSWAERKRMFDLPSSSWADYDASLISKGGGVFARDSKVISLSKQAQAALGIDQKDIAPETLISAILKSPADLIWFGGIGTYIKAEAENNVQVGDPANDSLRVNACDVRAKVVGEGANLGVTQAGRIAFALRGGRINTDFIDNSAGVDCSDNEVNIKIALAAARRSGKISEKARNALLEDMTDEVADIVLEDNRLQALALSIAQIGGAQAMPSHLRLIEKLEESGDLDRKTEGLADSETLMRRAGDGHGLTRPELAVLLSTTKLVLQSAIEQSPLVNDKALVPVLVGTFPQPMQDKFRRQILNHRLNAELIATKLANRIVNRLGLIHPFELAEEEGVSLAQIAAAYVAVEELLGLRDLWLSIETARMPETARLLLLARTAAAVSSHMADLLRESGASLEPAQMIAHLAKGVTKLSDSAGSMLSEVAQARSRELQAQFVEAGAPAALAQRVVYLFDLDGAIGLAGLAKESSVPTETLTRAFIKLGTELGLDWAQQSAEDMAPSDPWERLLVNGLARDFQQMRLDFLRRRKAPKSGPEAVVDRWLDSQSAAVAQFKVMIGRAQLHMPVTPAIMAQVASQARNLLER